MQGRHKPSIHLIGEDAEIYISWMLQKLYQYILIKHSSLNMHFETYSNRTVTFQRNCFTYKKFTFTVSSPQIGVTTK